MPQTTSLSLQDRSLSLSLKDTRGNQNQSPGVPSTPASQLMADLLQEDEGQMARARGTFTHSRLVFPCLTPLGIHHPLFPVLPKCQVYTIYDYLV